MIIETYIHHGVGYNPFLIRDSWQVAKLNYMPGQGMSEIAKMDKHMLTDEAFILVKGTAVLIAAELKNGSFSFNCLKMEAGVTYNINAHTWHNIAMECDAEVLIVERNNTHISDFVFKYLADGEKEILLARVRAAVY